MGWDPGKALGDATGIEWNPKDDIYKDVKKASKFIKDNNKSILAQYGTEVFNVFTGKYADDQKRIAKTQDHYKDVVAEYEKAIDSLQSKYVIDDEIFQIKASNDAFDVQKEYQTELKAIKNKLDKLVKDFNSDYKHFQSLLDDKYLKYIAWTPLVVGGFVSDVKDAITKGDWEAARRAVNIVIRVAVLVLTVVVAVVATASTGGAATVFAIAAVTSAITQLISLVLTLDNMYGQNLLMNGVFSILDFYLNDILHLDENFKELGTYKLSDTKYYEELTGYITTVNTIVNAVASIAMLGSTPPEGLADKISAISPTLGSVSAITSSMEYQALYTIYNSAMLYKNYEKQEEALKALKEKSIEDVNKIQNKISTMRKRKMMKAYKAEEQMLTDTSDILSEYVMSSFSNPTSTFDPEMTIAANYGYEYSGDNIMSFVPDYTTDYEELAGGSKHINKILYRTN